MKRICLGLALLVSVAHAQNKAFADFILTTELVATCNNELTKCVSSEDNAMSLVVLMAGDAVKFSIMIPTRYSDDIEKVLEMLIVGILEHKIGTLSDHDINKLRNQLVSASNVKKGVETYVSYANVGLKYSYLTEKNKDKQDIVLATIEIIPRITYQ